VLAEEPSRGWLPSTGTLHRFRPGRVPGVRYDLGFGSGSVISPRYDSLLGKVIAHAATRQEAAGRLAVAMDQLEVHGITTDRALLAAILREPDFLAGRTTTGYLDAHPDLVPAADAGLDAIAASLWTQARRRRGQSLPSGWRNVRSQGQHAIWQDGDRRVEVTYVVDGDTFHAAVGGQDVDGRILSVGDEHIHLETGGFSIRYACQAAAGSVWVASPERQTTLVEVPRFATANAGAAAGLGPTAPVPGTIIAVEVAAGDTITAGQTLVVLEAMKLEHRIRAETDGVVTSVPVKVGDKVDARQILVVVGDAAGDAV
jgi:propionyl-CoA carboxylase alpha chain